MGKTVNKQWRETEAGTGKAIDLRVSGVIEAAETAPVSPDIYYPIHLIASSVLSSYRPALIQWVVFMSVFHRHLDKDG